MELEFLALVEVMVHLQLELVLVLDQEWDLLARVEVGYHRPAHKDQVLQVTDLDHRNDRSLLVFLKIFVLINLNRKTRNYLHIQYLVVLSALGVLIRLVLHHFHALLVVHVLLNVIN